MMTGDLESSLYAQINEKRRQVSELREQVVELRAQLAERDATITGDNLENQYLFQIAALQGRVAKHKATLEHWQATGDAIMLCATGKAAPLSDSDVCGVIVELRAQVATLTERLSRCTCTDDFGNVTG